MLIEQLIIVITGNPRKVALQVKAENLLILGQIKRLSCQWFINQTGNDDFQRQIVQNILKLNVEFTQPKEVSAWLSDIAFHWHL